MKTNFNVAEILKSVDVIVADNKYEAYNKNKIINKYKRFGNRNIDMSDNPESEKIIFDAEKSLEQKAERDLIQKENLELARKREIRNLENNSDIIKPNPLVLNTTTSFNADLSKPLILEKEYIEVEKNLEDYDLTENILEEDNQKELENNYIHKNELLKSENIKQEEVIKDLNTLLYNFKKQRVYSDLYKKIKLYQEDNAILRKKIFALTKTETHLRLQLSELTLNKQVNENKAQKFEESDEIEKKEVNKLNTQIENLSQHNNRLQSELLSFKNDKENQSTNISQKIKFYREEYAKVIVDKSDIQRKLEISKNQLLVNEKNKIELKIALENLNQILASSNIETRAFGNENEEFLNKPRKEK